MSGIGDLFALFRDLDFDALAAQADHELVIALAGQGDARDRLHRALATRLDSLWQSSPFRLVETAELEAIGAAAIPATDDSPSDRKRLLIYGIPDTQTTDEPTAKALRHLLDTPGVSLIVAVVPPASPTERDPHRLETRAKRPARLQGLGNARLRLLEGRARPDQADHYDVNTADATANDPAARLSQLGLLNFPTPGKTPSGGSFRVVTLDSLDLAGMEDALFPAIIGALPERELALARRAPIFQNAVANHVIAHSARTSAQTLVLANVTAGIPFVSGLLNVDGSDFLLLTGNQIALSHKLAIIYGQKRDNPAEIWLEALPFVVAAFVWRWAAKRVIMMLPVSQSLRPVFGLLPRVALGYGGTWLMGLLSRFYYSTGQRHPLDDARRFLDQRQGSGVSAQVIALINRAIAAISNRPTATPDATPDSDRGRAAQ